MISLGVTVTDRITGFSGIATGRCQYISGCDQVLVQPPLDGDGKFVDARWLDVQRLNVVTASSSVVLDNTSTPGADVSAPVR